MKQRQNIPNYFLRGGVCTRGMKNRHISRFISQTIQDMAVVTGEDELVYNGLISMRCGFVCVADKAERDV